MDDIAHLAAMLLGGLWPEHAHDLPKDLVKNALSISGLYDLEPLMRKPFLKDSLQLTPAPVSAVLYSVTGGDESEKFLRQSVLIEQAWGQQRVPVRETMPSRNPFSVLEALVEPEHRLHRLARELLLSTA